MARQGPMLRKDAAMPHADFRKPYVFDPYALCEFCTQIEFVGFPDFRGNKIPNKKQNVSGVGLKLLYSKKPLLGRGRRLLTGRRVLAVFTFPGPV